MGVILFILPAVGIGVGIRLLRGIPRRKQLWLAFFLLVWTAVTIGIGFLLGEVAPTYRGDIAIQRLLRDTNQSLQNGDCEKARAAFSEVHEFVEGGGLLRDAVNMIAERLRPSTSPPTPTAQPQ